MTCIIVEDEPLAIEILETYIEKVSFLELINSCNSAIEALQIINSQQIDLIFLDIQMPELSGMQLYQALNSKPMVIFTTAYSEYAVEGFEVNAVDYLVKPFSFERFMKAVVKADEIYNSSHQSIKPPSSKSQKKYLFVKDGTKTLKIMLNDILYMESMKDYIKIYTKLKPILTLMSMQNMLDLLPAEEFIRVHRSFIVPISKIDSIERNRIIVGEIWIPIGNMYKENFFQRIK